MAKQKELTKIEMSIAKALRKRGHRFSSCASMFNSNQRGPSVGNRKIFSSNKSLESDLPTIEEVEIKKKTFLKHYKNMEEMIMSGIEDLLVEDDISEIKKRLKLLMKKFSYLPPLSMLDDKEKEHIERVKRFNYFSNKISKFLDISSFKEGENHEYH